MDFNRYSKLVNQFYENDNREINFQNRVIIPFLEELFGNEIDIVDTSTLYKNWKTIDRERFAGDYTPDILIAKNWSLFKRQANTEYLALIEVKTPNARDSAHAIKEVKEYQDKVDKVILTNCLTWEFYFNKQYEAISLEKTYEGKSMAVSTGSVSRIVKWNDSLWEKLLEKLLSIIKEK